MSPNPATRLAGASSDALSQLVQGMPKAELHIHVEGALEPEMLFSLAQRNRVPLPYRSVEELRSAYDFENLQSFLNLYNAGAMVLRSADDFHEMASSYLARARLDNVLHSEIFFDTQTHTARGLSPDTVIEGLHRACSEAPAAHGMSAALILCFLRHLSEDEAFAALEQAEPHLDKIVGVGLASAEMGHPPEKFARVFAKARRMGLRLVAHAGEEGPPSYVWSAIDVLKADRIDHGVRAMEDGALLARLARSGIPLTVCPLSNVRLNGFPSLAAHPLRKLLDLGIRATVNSDDPAYFGGHVNENLTQSFQALGMDAGHAYALAANSFDASFISAARRLSLIDHLDSYFDSFEPAPRIRTPSP